jgi:2-polyprenyl-6-methoxyphenol hydroxylase-like FAD-dependent oxidoreductase
VDAATVGVHHGTVPLGTGSLIAPGWVVTLARFVRRRPADGLSVLGGSPELPVPVRESYADERSGLALLALSDEEFAASCVYASPLPEAADATGARAGFRPGGVARREGHTGDDGRGGSGAARRRPRDPVVRPEPPVERTARRRGHARPRPLALPAARAGPDVQGGGAARGEDGLTPAQRTTVLGLLALAPPAPDARTVLGAVERASGRPRSRRGLPPLTWRDGFALLAGVRDRADAAARYAALVAALPPGDEQDRLVGAADGVARGPRGRVLQDGTPPWCERLCAVRPVTRARSALQANRRIDQDASILNRLSLSYVNEVMDTESKTRTGHAVVVGGSVSGLLAARALSPTFAQVTVFDRDALPAAAAPRRGVPQSRHAHALLFRGAMGLDGLFPGFTDAMVAAGVPYGDLQADFSWVLDGHEMAGATSGLRGYMVSRPLLEAMVRERVRALPNVTVVENAQVNGLVLEDERVVGARVQRDGDGEETVSAELVVDAAGRGSRALTWLGEFGYPVPEETVVKCNVVYVTRQYKWRPELLDGGNGATVAPFPGHPRAGVVVRQEGDRFILLLAGMLGEEPPTDDAGMLDFASTLAAPQVAEVLRAGTPLGDAVKMRYPESSLRHFDKLDRHLDGFLVVGDALCSFNPIYGQGMTTAVMEAELLQSLLEGTDREKLASRFFAAAAALLVEPWSLAAGGDLRFPEVEGERGPQDEEINQYLTQYRAAAAIDPVLGTAFLRVSNMIAPITSLFSPELMERTQRALAQ